MPPREGSLGTPGLHASRLTVPVLDLRLFFGGDSEPLRMPRQTLHGVSTRQRQFRREGSVYLARQRAAQTSGTSQLVHFLVVSNDTFS